MDEDRLCAPGCNLIPNEGHLIERLPAKSTSEVTKENQQNRRLIDYLKQRAARLRSILAQNSGQLLLLGELCGRGQRGLVSLAKVWPGMLTESRCSLLVR